jgi:hypothetical protein
MDENTVPPVGAHTWVERNEAKAEQDFGQIEFANGGLSESRICARSSWTASSGALKWLPRTPLSELVRTQQRIRLDSQKHKQGGDFIRDQYCRWTVIMAGMWDCVYTPNSRFLRSSSCHDLN